MQPKEKAQELYDKFYKEVPIHIMHYELHCILAKSYARICAWQIMKDAEEHWNEDGRNYEHSAHFKYWNEVKDEITKI